MIIINYANDVAIVWNRLLQDYLFGICWFKLHCFERLRFLHTCIRFNPLLSCDPRVYFFLYFTFDRWAWFG